MPLLTSLESEPRSGGVRLRVDGEPFATVAAADVAALRLRTGTTLDERTLAALARCADVFAARDVASRMLAGRALPSTELVRRLVRKGHNRDAAQVAVEQLVEKGLINDAEFARHFARTRSRTRRVGPMRLQRELQRFGIGSHEAQDAVQEALEADGVDVPRLLADAAARKLRSLKGKEPRAARRSLRAYLLRQGFAAGDIAAYMRKGVRWETGDGRR